MRVAHPPGLGKSRGFDFENRVSSSAAYSSFDLGILSVCVNLSVTPFVERASNEIENRSIQGQAQEDLPHDHELVVSQAPHAFPLTASASGCVLNMRWRGKLIFEKSGDLALLGALLVAATRAWKLKEVNP